MSFSVGCFGYGGTVSLITQFSEDLHLAGIEVRTCHEYANATVPYHRDRIFEFIDSCDIIVLPGFTKIQPAKSVNRLALATSRRKACIVSPLAAYFHYFTNGESVLVAETKEQWLEAIFKLRDDLELRNRLANNGYDVAKTLHPTNQISKLMAELARSGVYGSTSFVQVIIPHYAPRLDYLKLAVKSVAASYGSSLDVLVVSSSKLNPTEELTALSTERVKVRVIYQSDPLTFSQANNIGIQNADSRTTHYLFLNDDTILSKNALNTMVNAYRKPCILNPYSNCDKGWLHNDVMKLSSGKELVPDMKIEDFSSAELDLFSTTEFQKEVSVVPSPFCAFYCTLIDKEIVDKVGALNTLFRNGGEDLDYCERAKRYGYECLWTKAAFCFHFGGKTRKVTESENFEKHHKEDVENNTLTRKRWQGKRMAIWTGPAWETWDMDSYKTTGIGGSETCAARLAQTAAENGHSVTLYGAHERKEQYGVQLMPWDSFKPEEEYFDLFIASRNVNCIDGRLKAKKILVWAHDIWLLSGQNISEYHRNKVDAFVCLSPWHRDFFSDHHKLPANKITIIPNGVNVELFDKPNLDAKKYGKLIYSSSPDRGLDNLIYLMVFAKDKVPELHLDVYYGFHNYESSIRQRNNADEVKRINELKEFIEKHSSFVTMHGRISQPELAKKWAETYVWCQPTLFTETYCAVETTNISMADGTYKKIPYIVDGDNVVTHSGTGVVTKTMKRQTIESIYKIKIKNLKDALEVTGEHPILVARFRKNKCARFDGYCTKNKIGCTYYKYRGKKEEDHIITEPCYKYKKEYVTEWVKASEINKRDYVCIVKNNKCDVPPTFMSVVDSNFFDYRGDYNENHHSINNIKDFKIDEDFLEFCGWYAAEGVFDGRSAIIFSLHKEEEEQATFIKSQISRLGLTFREDFKQDSKTRTIVTHSVILGKFFVAFGRISKDRRIPQWIKNLDAGYLRYFLRGLYHGDGCEILNTVRLECASSNLIYDLFEVFLKFGCVSYTANSLKKKPLRISGSIVHSESETLPAYLSGCSMSQNKELFAFFGYVPNEDGCSKSYVSDDSYFYLPVTKIEQYEFNGDVYNFEVEGANSYIANGVVVHNCITAKEAQLSATPIVCSNVAALQTTVGEYGHLVKNYAYGYEARVEFVDQIIKLHKDKDYWLEMSNKSYQGAANISWGDRWKDYWSKWL